MEDVVDVKDLGSGVIGRTECDHFAFRKKDVDLCRSGSHTGVAPYPCRVRHRDQGRRWQSGSIRIQIRNWKTGNDVASGGFSFTPPPSARRVDVADLAKLKDMSDLPSNFGRSEASDDYVEEEDPPAAAHGRNDPGLEWRAARLGRLSIPGFHSLIVSAEAVVGRPLTPVSVAGVGPGAYNLRRCAARRLRLLVSRRQPMRLRRRPQPQQRHEADQARSATWSGR